MYAERVRASLRPTLLFLVVLLGCGERTDLSYEELLDEHRDAYGPFVQCGVESLPCEEGPGAAEACLANGIASCTPVEHLSFEENDALTTFVTPAGDSCEIIVFRELGRDAIGADFRRERCESVDISQGSCINFMRCNVEKRWRRER